MANLISFITKRCRPFSRFCSDEILILAKRDRGTPFGYLATCTSTRKGDREVFIRVNGIKIRYMVSFYLPRFFTMQPSVRLDTVIHELVHIAPDFSGKMNPLKHGKQFEHKVGEQRDYLISQFPQILELPVLTKPGTRFSFLSFRKPGPRFSQSKIWTQDDLKPLSL